MSRGSLRINYRIALGRRRAGQSLRQFQRNSKRAMTLAMKDVQKAVLDSPELRAIHYRGNVERAVGSPKAIKVTAGKNLVRGFFQWPRGMIGSIYGPVTEYGTREDGVGALSSWKAVPTIAEIELWLVNKFGHNKEDPSTRKIAYAIVRNIAREGLPTNLSFDRRGWIRRAAKDRTHMTRAILRNSVVNEVRKLQIFPLRVAGSK